MNWLYAYIVLSWTWMALSSRKTGADEPVLTSMIGYFGLNITVLIAMLIAPTMPPVIAYRRARKLIRGKRA